MTFLRRLRGRGEMLGRPEDSRCVLNKTELGQPGRYAALRVEVPPGEAGWRTALSRQHWWPDRPVARIGDRALPQHSSGAALKEREPRPESRVEQKLGHRGNSL